MNLLFAFDFCFAACCGWQTDTIDASCRVLSSGSKPVGCNWSVSMPRACTHTATDPPC